MGDVICAFVAAMSEYQAYLISEAGSYEKLAVIDVDKYTTLIECTEDHCSEKCVLCLDRFQIGDKCLQLPCNHMFHRQEVEKHLYQTPSCPLCRTCIIPKEEKKTKKIEVETVEIEA